MVTQIESYLIQLGFSPESRRTLICQAAHESNYWKSKLFTESFNMFGMKAHKRVVIGKTSKINGGYATYSSIEGSINDLINWCRRTGAIDKTENIIEYSDILKKKGYYEDSKINYTKGLLSAYNHLFSESYAKYNGAKI